jgi:hypothetical protein
MKLFANDRYQDVNTDAIQTCLLTALSEVPEKTLDAQVLFDPFGEKFDLPT